MPIYEYECRGCRSRFETIVQGPNIPTPSCPSCNGIELDRLLSTFAVGTSSPSLRPSTSPAPCGSCGDPRGPGACSMD